MSSGSFRGAPLAIATDDGTLYFKWWFAWRAVTSKSPFKHAKTSAATPRESPSGTPDGHTSVRNGARGYPFRSRRDFVSLAAGLFGIARGEQLPAAHIFTQMEKMENGFLDILASHAQFYRSPSFDSNLSCLARIVRERGRRNAFHCQMGVSPEGRTLNAPLGLVRRNANGP